MREETLGAAEAGVFGEEFHGLYRTQLRRPKLDHARVARLGIEQTLRQRCREVWLARNASGIEAYNRNIDRHGAFSDTVRGF
jgi:post-segregation antitoxin (ccd killing protein)